VNGLGLSGATKRVADHARSIVQLEIQLATAELKKKAAALGVGIGVLVGAALFAFFTLSFALAAATAGIATALPVWESLLIMFGALLVLTAILGAIGVVLVRKGAKPVPEQAVAEAQITAEALRNGDRV
jgi:hypothetical protein